MVAHCALPPLLPGFAPTIWNEPASREAKNWPAGPDRQPWFQRRPISRPYGSASELAVAYRRACATLSIEMETVAKPKAISPRRSRAGRQRPTQIRGSSSRTRNLSEPTRRAHQAFAELEPFFATKTDFARALGWSSPTLRQWLDTRPSRPREDTVRSLLQLRDVAVAAGKWLSDPHGVGEWLVSPHPQLLGAVPAELARDLPAEGVELLVDDMALIAPKEQAKPGSVTMSVDLLRETLRKLRAPGIRPAEPAGEVDLSDFD